MSKPEYEGQMSWRDPATGQARTEAPVGLDLYEEIESYQPETGRTIKIKVPVRRPSSGSSGDLQGALKSQGRPYAALKPEAPRAPAGGMKFDQGKAPVGLIPFEALALAAAKPTADLCPEALYDEALDHLIMWFAKKDTEALCSAGSNILTLLELSLVDGDTDRVSGCLYPGRACLAIAEVLRLGALKYAPDSWQKVPNGLARYGDAVLRHLFAWDSGEEFDPEFKTTTHLAHAATSVLFMIHLACVA